MAVIGALARQLRYTPHLPRMVRQVGSARERLFACVECGTPRRYGLETV